MKRKVHDKRKEPQSATGVDEVVPGLAHATTRIVGSATVSGMSGHKTGIRAATQFENVGKQPCVHYE